MSDQQNDSIYQFTVKNIDGKAVSLKEYEGKVLMIVNTASKCGFTPQLDELADLYQEFREEGFEVLAFPSNDFAGQEPLNAEEIKAFCMTKFNAEYPIFEKVHVIGKKPHELYQFLADKKQNGKVGVKPKWNFHKYLVDKQGKVAEYYFPFTKPTAGTIKRSIRKLLDK